MHFSKDDLARVTGVRMNSNLGSVYEGLVARGEVAGLTRPHRLVHYIAQLAHESMDFVHDREIWGPTSAQRRYEGRADLGNTQAGDGSKFRGYTATQITGRYNTTAFYQWCLELGAPITVPNFLDDPKLMNTDPWEGLGPIWYWETRKLNRYADAGDPEMVTKIINGGYNGLADRLENFTEIGLRLLGYGAGDVRTFQGDAKLVVDGIAGRDTRAAIQSRLEALPDLVFGEELPSISFTADKETGFTHIHGDNTHRSTLTLAKIRRILAEHDADV